MYVVHAGNRVDGEDRSAGSRFPASQVPFVRTRLAGLLEQLHPEAVVSAAAAGADLILLEEALRLKLAVHVVLPFGRDKFRDESVADQGQAWVESYERVLDAIARRPDDCRLVEHDLAATPAGFREGNQVLFDHALGLPDGSALLAIAVRPRGGEDSNSVTDDFVDRAAVLGVTCIDLDPGVRQEDMRRAFVAMPFGTKPRDGGHVDCDSIFGKLIVPALEDADIAWLRADKEVDTGLIHIGMIEQLGNADVVLVDTITQNPNVFYELGLRHALADKTTILLGPAGDSPPFDVRPIRHFSYRLLGESIDELSALQTIDSLRPVLDPDRLAKSRRDSPVFEYFELERLRLSSRGGSTGAESLSLQLHQRATAATADRDTSALVALVADARAAPVAEDQRRLVLLRAGIALRDLGQYDKAVETLRPLAYEQAQGPFELWAQQLAMSLRRRGEHELDNGGDPEPLWDEAQRLLDQAIELGDDPESCGIAAGLQKRRGLRAHALGDRPLAIAHLTAAVSLYQRGFTAAPSDFYTGLNAVTTLRILTQRLGAPAEGLTQVSRLLPVVEFFAERAAASGSATFWAVVSSAELRLTRHLLEGDPSADDVEDAYLKAAMMRPTPDQAQTAIDQLEMYERLGDPPELIARLTARMVPFLQLAGSGGAAT
jgi:tetratricopeptide (TPR) repeat protein